MSDWFGTGTTSSTSDNQDDLKNLMIAIYDKFKSGNNDFFNDVGGRFYKGIADEGADYPYAVCLLISDSPEKTFTEDYENVDIQFSLFSNNSSSLEIENMYSHLKALYDECSMSPTGLSLIWMKRQNAILMPEDITTQNGSNRVWHYAVDYTVKISKH